MREPGDDRREDRSDVAGTSHHAPGKRDRVQALKKELSRKREERSRISRDLQASLRGGGGTEHLRNMDRIRSVKKEVFVLQREIHAARQGMEAGQAVGALPDFAIIGAPKCGTTFLYHLLVEHPHVEPAAFKEIHYFDLLFHKGAEWYLQCFPKSRRVDGRMTITGEATPAYLADHDAPERMADIAPGTRLIALLRNPVDRLYSDYHFFGSRRGRDVSRFDEFARTVLEDPRRKTPSQGVYVDQLLRWSALFDREQMLVLKSEDMFENLRDNLRTVLDFLELSHWTPEKQAQSKKQNKGSYEQVMDPDTRRRLEEYYRPHNRRLYEYLGVDFGW